MQENIRKEEYAQRWLSVDQGVRSEIKQAVSLQCSHITHGRKHVI